MSKKTPQQISAEITSTLNDKKATVSNLLKDETPIYLVAASLGQSLKATKAFVKRFKLEDNLRKPELIGQ